MEKLLVNAILSHLSWQSAGYDMVIHATSAGYDMVRHATSAGYDMVRHVTSVGYDMVRHVTLGNQQKDLPFLQYGLPLPICWQS